MTTGMMDLMMSSGLRTATEQIPTPDLAVPYAAPMFPKTRADTIPIPPKKRAWLGSPYTIQKSAIKLSNCSRVTKSYQSSVRNYLQRIGLVAADAIASVMCQKL